MVQPSADAARSPAKHASESLHLRHVNSLIPLWNQGIIFYIYKKPSQMVIAHLRGFGFSRLFSCYERHGSVKPPSSGTAASISSFSQAPYA